MDFEMDAAFIEANGLTAEQVTAIKSGVTIHTTDLLATEKLAWDSKATTDAEAIIEGAISSTVKDFNIDLPRLQGEKNKDYLVRVNAQVFANERTNIDTLKTEYAAKLKDFKGDDATAAELATAKQKLDDAQKLLVDYDALKLKAAKTDELTSANSELTKRLTFGDVKPNFPDTVDEYRAKAKWEEFEAKTEKLWNVVYVDGKAMAVDKENPHKVVELKSLVDADESISELLKGRQQTGTNGKPTKLTAIEGVPFEIPENCTTKDRAALIKDYLTKQGMNVMSSEYSSKFKQYNDTILQKTAS